MRSTGDGTGYVSKTKARAASKPWYTQLLQAEANRWLRTLRAEGFAVPARVVVYTNLRQFDRAAGFKRWERMMMNDENQGLCRGESYLSTRGAPIAYVRMRFYRHEGRGNPHRTLIHELLHFAMPDLPHWKVRALATHFYERRNVELIHGARSRAEYMRNRAKS